MEYRIKIEVLIRKSEKTYPESEEIYSQIREDINLLEVIKAFNDLKKND
jgi:hypothetical protein